MATIKSLAAAVAVASMALSGAASANSNSTDWGVHDLAELGTGSHFFESGSFSDIWSFSLAQTTDLTSTTVAINLPKVFGIGNGVVNLFSGKANDAVADTLVGSYNFDGSTGDTAHTYASLLSGSYFYQVNGTITGPLGGTYALASSAAPSAAAPVPEPETYAMLLAGLGVVGIAARRRVK